MIKNEQGYPIVSTMSELYDAKQGGYLFVSATCRKCGYNWSGNLIDSYMVIKNGCPDCVTNMTTNSDSLDFKESDNNVSIINDDKDRYIKALSTKRDADIKIDNYLYKGYGNCNSYCKLEIWKEEDKAVVLFTDINIGTSVTNASDILVTEIYNNFLLDYDKKNCLFMETYDEAKGVDIIVPKWKGSLVHDVTWIHLGKIKED